MPGAAATGTNLRAANIHCDANNRAAVHFGRRLKDGMGAACCYLAAERNRVMGKFSVTMYESWKTMVMLTSNSTRKD